MGNHTETVCDASGCHIETDVIAWAMDNPWLAISLGVVLGSAALFLLARFLNRFRKMWKRPARAAIITAAWGGIGFFLWPHLGALPLLGSAFIFVLMPLNWVVGYVTKNAPPSSYWCEFCEREYSEGYCRIHD